MYTKIARDRVISRTDQWIPNKAKTWVMYVSNKANELIRFLGHKVEGQRSQGSLCIQK